MRLAARLAIVVTSGAVLTAIGAMVNADAQDLRPGRVATPGFIDGDVAASASGASPAGAAAATGTGAPQPKAAAPGTHQGAQQLTQQPPGQQATTRPGAAQQSTPQQSTTQQSTTQQSTTQQSTTQQSTTQKSTTQLSIVRQRVDVSRFDVRPWAASMAPKVGIPETALAAYGSAELRLAQEDPGCHLSWVALAGIGSVESDHGRFGGAVIRPDGTSWPPIIGVALDGAGVGHVPDSDGGALDGDRTYDRAVGPMQFLPGTWRMWGADADGDGVANPFALPDAALAAGRYLCAVHGDLRQAGPWRAALWSYNRSDAYAAEVSARSNAYAVASLR